MKRSSRPQLGKFFQSVRQPLFLLDNDAVMFFCNPALEQWTNCPAEQLLGQQLRYRSSASRLKHELIAAALAPPPEVLQEKKRCRTLLTIDKITAQSRRYAEFIPLPPGSILVLVDEHEAPPQSPLSEPAQSVQRDAASELHQTVLLFRRRQAGRFQWDKMLGVSPKMQRVRRLSRLAVEQNISVLFVGETGTGKEYLASAIHYGQSSAGMFVPLDCRRLDGELIVSSVHAFQKQCKAEEQSQRHTLLLKDADALPGTLLPLFTDFGSASSANQRLMATTTLEPESWTNNPALPFVLGTLRIDLPPLRNRKEDIPVLAQMFLEENNKNVEKQHSGFTSDALDALIRYDWKGNIAELEQQIAEAHRSAAAPLVSAADLPMGVRRFLDANAQRPESNQSVHLEAFLEEKEKELIRDTLRRTQGNRTKTAEELGLTRQKLYRRLEYFGLVEP